MENHLPKSIVIFGASGDLTRRKLIPSLFNLCRKGRLSEPYRIIGSGGTAFVMDNLIVTPHTAASAAPVLQKLRRASGATSFSWSALAGATYLAQYTTNLSQPNWTNLGSPLTTGNYTLTASDTAANPQRFYRVVVLP